MSDRNRRTRLRGIRAAVIAAAVLATCLLPSGASAAIRIYENSEAATFLGEVRKGNCKVKRNGRLFRASAKTTNGAYTLELFILDFRGFGREYNLEYGTIKTTVSLEGVTNGADFDNAFPFPGGQPPGSAGAIAFPRSGAKVGVGAYALPNQDYSQGVALAGAMKCNYPGR